MTSFDLSQFINYIGIYTVNRNEEIVMPAERSGKIKENYEWKVRIVLFWYM